MKIDKSNYEIFVMDYLDGKLDVVDVSELLIFLEQNTELKKEFDMLNQAAPGLIENENIEKSFLKKPSYINVKEEFENLIIAQLEGNISHNETAELNKAFILYPELIQDQKLFKYTQLQADKNIVFEKKTDLKKAVPVYQINFQYAWRVAAVLAFFAFVMFGIYLSKSTITQNKFATNENMQKESSNKSIPHINSEIAGKKKQSIKTKNYFDKQHNPKKELIEARQIQLQVIESKDMGLISISMEMKTETLSAVSFVQQQLKTTTDNNTQTGFKNIQQLAVEQIQQTTKGVVTEKNKPVSAINNISVSDLGLLFVKLYNNATGDDAKVVRKYDTTGNIIGFGIAANNFQFSTGK